MEDECESGARAADTGGGITDTVAHIGGVPCYIKATFHVGNAAISDTVHVPGMLLSDVEVTKACYGRVSGLTAGKDESAEALSAGGCLLWSS